MKNLLTLMQGLSLQRQLIVVAATVGVFVSILMLSRFAETANQTLLYAGLDPRAAGEVVAVLDQVGAQYEVKGESIYVSGQDRDALRMQLASQGLPASGDAGYELLDSLSGFGTTSQMFDATYWRAKEGELARTILSMSNVRSARVHISSVDKGGFSREKQISASVTISTSSGKITAEQADALRHLVASSVGNMSPNDVTVVDTVAGLIPAENGKVEGATASRAEKIKLNIERLLAARVGAGRALVEVSLDVVRDRETFSERIIDPQGKVIISSETETMNENETRPSPDVTVASNLPGGDAAAEGNGKSQATKNKERINFEISETHREVLREPGAIRRMSVAVLVDGQEVINEDGTLTWEPRSEQELTDLKELVISAAGIDENRGDTLTLKSMQFQAESSLGTEASTGLMSYMQSINVMSVIQSVILAGVAVFLGLFVLKPILSPKIINDARNSKSEGELLFAPNSQEEPKQLSVMNDSSSGQGESAKNVAMISDKTSKIEDTTQGDPVARLRNLIDQRKEESVEILRGWLEKKEEHS